MAEYDPDVEFKEIERMIEDGATVDDVRERVDKVKEHVGRFAEDLALVKRSRTGFTKITKANAALEEEIEQLKVDKEAERKAADDEYVELQTLADSLRQPIAKQCERVRLHRMFRGEAASPNAFNLIKSIAEITRDRETEVLGATKQLRELKMILKMMKQHEAELEIESNNQILEKTSEKDRDIFNLALRCMREREQLLEDVKAMKMDIDAIEEHLKAGHYESKAKKEEKLKDYRAKIQREYSQAEGVVSVFDQPPTEGANLPTVGDKSELTLTKANASDPSGLQFEDKTRLAGVTPGSAAEKCGFAKYIGRRVTHFNGNEIRPGFVMKLKDVKSVHFKFDMDGERLRCSYIKDDGDDPFKVFAEKAEKYKDPYKDMEAETANMKKKTNDEKRALMAQQKNLKDYIMKSEKERTEKEREIKGLTQKLSAARIRQAEYEQESQKLFAWMELSQKTLEGLNGKVSKGKRAIANGTESKKITGPKNPQAEEPTSPPSAKADE